MCRVYWIKHTIQEVLKLDRCWGDAGSKLFRPCIMEQPLVAKPSLLMWTGHKKDRCCTSIVDVGPTSVRLMYHEQLPLTKTFYLSGYKVGSLVQHQTNSVVIIELPVAKKYPSVPDIGEKLDLCLRCRPNIHPAFARTLLCFLSI